MWQLFVLGSLAANALENVIDKHALVKEKHVDSTVASFYRPFLFFIFSVLIGTSGIFGPLTFSFHWSVFLFIPLAIGTSTFYTYILKRVEITSIGVAGYITPFLFLLIDTHIAEAAISLLQIVGIVSLVVGGVCFSLDGKTRRIKSELTWQVWLVFLFGVFYGGVQAYLFQYLNTTHGVNSPSFFASLWLWGCLGLLAVVFIRGKGRLLLVKPSLNYLPSVATSKSFDALSAVLWGQALIFATISQVNAMEALDPLILFIMVIVVQVIFKIHLNEKLVYTHIWLKLLGVLFLVVGAFLVG